MLAKIIISVYQVLIKDHKSFQAQDLNIYRFFSKFLMSVSVVIITSHS